jgi:hypothetical protein
LVEGVVVHAMTAMKCLDIRGKILFKLLAAVHCCVIVAKDPPAQQAVVVVNSIEKMCFYFR